MRDFPLLQPFPIALYTQTEQWIEGTGTLYRTADASLSIDMPSQIQPGTSGSPIVTDEGTIVAILSVMNVLREGYCQGMEPRPHLALPVWTVRRIQETQIDGDAYPEDAWRGR